MLVCFTLAGSSGLIYEIVWTRKLGFTFGSTALALSSCLTVYLAGIALGSYLSGRIADRIERPGRAFAVMQLAIGVCGLLSLPLLDAGESSYALFKPLAFLVVALALLPPTVLIGGSLPVLVRATQRRSTVVAVTGRLYSFNTLGSVAGAALAAFVLLPHWGMFATAAAASMLNLAIAIIVWRTFGDSEAPPVKSTPVPALAPALVISVIMAVSGFCGLLDEVIWTRTLEPVTGNSTWAFAIVLSPYLLGLALGIAAGTRLARASALLRRIGPVALVAWTLSLTATTVFIGMFFVHLLPGWLSSLYAGVAGQPGWFLVLEALVCGSISLIPAFWTGAVFPLVLAVSSNQSGSGALVGRLYSINTAGAIAGACLAGLVVIPWLGLRGGLLLAISLNLALAAVVLICAPGHWRGRMTAGAIPIAAAAAVLYTAPPWDQSGMATGVNYLYSTIYANGQDYLSAMFNDTRVLYYREGANGTVAVTQRGPVRTLTVDGMAEASAASATQLLLPHYAMATGPATRRALVIGYGGGNTAGSLALYPFEQIDVAEIEPATIDAGKLFEGFNHHPDRDPRVHIHTADARTWLAASPSSSYDVIVSHPSMPWTPGSAKLFTRDFFQIARKRLRPGGVFAQSIPFYNLDFGGVQSLLRTFLDAFPQMLVVTSGRPTGELILLGSDRPVKLDWHSLNQLFGTPERAGDLDRALLPNPGSVASRVLFGTAEIPALTAGAPFNTDNNGLIEFETLANQHRDLRDENVERLFESAVDARNYLTGAPTDAQTRLLVELTSSSVGLRDFRRGLVYAQELLRNDDSYVSNLVAGDVLYGLRRTPEAIAKWRRSLELQPGGTAAMLRLVRHYRPMWPRDRPPEFKAWVDALAARSSGAEVPVPPAFLANPVEP